MNTVYSSKALELILNNLSETLDNTKINIYLNSPSITEITSIDTNFSLYLSGDFLIEGTTAPTNTTFNICCDAILPSGAPPQLNITIPELPIEGTTIEKTVPMNFSLQCNEPINISGTAEGIIPKLQVTANSPEQEVSLPLTGKSSGYINLSAESLSEIPPLTASGKTESTELDVYVLGSTTQDLKLYGIATGKIPQLKVTGSTTKTSLELDLQADALPDINETSVECIESIERIYPNRSCSKDFNLTRYCPFNNKTVKFKMRGKAIGMLKSIPISGLTEAEEISLPMVEESNCSISLTSTGKLNIPEQNITLNTTKQPFKIITNLSDTVDLNLDGEARGVIPPYPITGSTMEDRILLNIDGKCTEPIKVNFNDTLEIPNLKIEGKMNKVTIPINIDPLFSSTSKIKGQAFGVIPSSSISGKAKLQNVPVIGKILATPNYTTKQPNFCGYISKVEDNLLYLRDDTTNNLITISIDSISYFTFETESSIISPNKFSNIQTYSNIEKALINTWYKDCRIALYGEKTSNPIGKVINTDDIKYINRGVMWAEEYILDKIINTIYYIYNLSAFSLINN